MTIILCYHPRDLEISRIPNAESHSCAIVSSTGHPSRVEKVGGCMRASLAIHGERNERSCAESPVREKSESAKR